MLKNYRIKFFQGTKNICQYRQTNILHEYKILDKMFENIKQYIKRIIHHDQVVYPRNVWLIEHLNGNHVIHHIKK